MADLKEEFEEVDVMADVELDDTNQEEVMDVPLHDQKEKESFDAELARKDGAEGKDVEGDDSSEEEEVVVKKVEETTPSHTELSTKDHLPEEKEEEKLPKEESILPPAMAISPEDHALPTSPPPAKVLNSRSPSKSPVALKSSPRALTSPPRVTPTSEDKDKEPPRTPTAPAVPTVTAATPTAPSNNVKSLKGLFEAATQSPSTPKATGSAPTTKAKGSRVPPPRVPSPIPPPSAATVTGNFEEDEHTGTSPVARDFSHTTAPMLLPSPNDITITPSTIKEKDIFHSSDTPALGFSSSEYNPAADRSSSASLESIKPQSLDEVSLEPEPIEGVGGTSKHPAPPSSDTSSIKSPSLKSSLFPSSLGFGGYFSSSPNGGVTKSPSIHERDDISRSSSVSATSSRATSPAIEQLPQVQQRSGSSSWRTGFSNLLSSAATVASTPFGASTPTQPPANTSRDGYSGLGESYSSPAGPSKPTITRNLSSSTGFLLARVGSQAQRQPSHSSSEGQNQIKERLRVEMDSAARELRDEEDEAGASDSQALKYAEEFGVGDEDELEGEGIGLGFLKSEPKDDGIVDGVDWQFWGAVMSDYEDVARSRPKDLSRAIQQGIPGVIRGSMWQLMSASKSATLEAKYSALLKLKSAHEKSIQKDLARTFPSHAYFQEAGGVGQENLFNVVKAYSLYDPQVGYTQGLAFIVAPLLLLMPEEEAFCVLVRLMESYDLRSHFLPEMPGLQLRLFQFDRLVEELLPVLYLHFVRSGIKSSMYASQWMMTMFSYRFPLALVFRIFDIVFAEGIEAIFRFCLALLKINEEKLLELDFEGMLKYLQGELYETYRVESPTDSEETLIANHGAGAWKANDFVRDAYTMKITPFMLDSYAGEYQEHLKALNAHAVEMDNLRTANRSLSAQVKNLESTLATMSTEHVELVRQLVNSRIEKEEMENELVRYKILYAELSHAQQEGRASSQYRFSSGSAHDV